MTTNSPTLFWGERNKLRKEAELLRRFVVKSFGGASLTLQHKLIAFAVKPEEISLLPRNHKVEEN